MTSIPVVKVDFYKNIFNRSSRNDNPARPKKWCSLLESNQRPPPYQGGALPTELSERLFQLSSMTAKNKPASLLDFSIKTNPVQCGSMERETGIEPALVAWKATVLPLNYSRLGILQTVLNQAKTKLVGGGRWMTPGILPSAPPGPACGCSKSLRAILSNLISISVVRIHLNIRPFTNNSGGGRWIRTTEGMSQQIYSLPPLAAWVSLQKYFNPSTTGGE
jgi:hypothetical protein